MLDLLHSPTQTSSVLGILLSQLALPNLFPGGTSFYSITLSLPFRFFPETSFPFMFTFSFPLSSYRPPLALLRLLAFLLKFTSLSLIQNFSSLDPFPPSFSFQFTLAPLLNTYTFSLSLSLSPSLHPYSFFASSPPSTTRSSSTRSLLTLASARLRLPTNFPPSSLSPSPRYTPHALNKDRTSATSSYADVGDTRCRIHTTSHPGHALRPRYRALENLNRTRARAGIFVRRSEGWRDGTAFCEL